MHTTPLLGGDAVTGHLYTRGDGRLPSKDRPYICHVEHVKHVGAGYRGIADISIHIHTLPVVIQPASASIFLKEERKKTSPAFGESLFMSLGQTPFKFSPKGSTRTKPTPSPECLGEF